MSQALNVKVRTASGSTASRNIFTEFNDLIDTSDGSVSEDVNKIINAYQAIVTDTVLPTTGTGANGQFKIVDTKQITGTVTATPGTDTWTSADTLRFTLMQGENTKTFTINNPATPASKENILTFLNLLVENSNYDGIKEAYIRSVDNHEIQLY